MPAGLISPHLDGTNASYFIFKAKILLSAICGVAVICMTSLFIFPNTAGRRVKRQSERILERLGNITFRALGEFCQVQGSCARPSSQLTVLEQGYIQES